MNACRISGTLLAAAIVSACAAPTEENLVPLTMTTDLRSQTLASAMCTRGNSPARITAAPDGQATGRVVGSNRNVFSGRIDVVDANSVNFLVQQGARDDEQLAELMTISDDGGTTVLQGKTFVCKDVLVRP